MNVMCILLIQYLGHAPILVLSNLSNTNKLLFHTPLNMHVGHVKGNYPCTVWSYQWYGTLLYVIYHTINSLRPFVVLQLPPVMVPILWVCGMYYSPHPAKYTCKPQQSCFSLPYVVILRPMIWNTAACNTSCHKRTAAEPQSLTTSNHTYFSGCI